jgi:hypothetical protein
MDDGRETARRKPALALLVDGVPGWQIVRHIPPGCACGYQPAQGIEELAQRIVALQASSFIKVK